MGATTMRMLLVIGAVILSAGCELFTNSGSDGSSSFWPDFSAGPDLADYKDAVEIRWELKDQNLTGMTGGFAITCGEAGVSTLSFTATHQTSGATKTTAGVPCPAMGSIGIAAIGLPDGSEGPFSVVGVADGKPASKSDRICNIRPPLGATVPIYVGGCDNPSCTDPCK